METSLFDFELDESKIAQYPTEPRDHSRLLLCQSEGRLGEFARPFSFEDQIFKDIPLGENDFVIINNAKVLPVRLLGTREKSHGSVECVLTGPITDLEWRAILKLSARIRPGMRLQFER